ncbi:hypothetical protein BDW71DRAFT_173555 [Aspergillus fruticulosus]
MFWRRGRGKGYWGFRIEADCILCGLFFYWWDDLVFGLYYIRIIIIIAILCRLTRECEYLSIVGRISLIMTRLRRTHLTNRLWIDTALCRWVALIGSFKVSKIKVSKKWEKYMQDDG